ncbi:MAG: hypothetical protein M3R62_05915, partial [Acidobacteriota bacterium]|nr:hypothetical protein [Acidobacteriota bacterium]
VANSEDPMSVDEKKGDGELTKLFWWPCPTCRLWHQTRVGTERLQADVIEVRCPVNGRMFERPVTRKRPAGEPWTAPHRSSVLRRLFRRFLPSR